MDRGVFTKRIGKEYGKWLVFITGKTETVDVPFFPVSSFDRGMFTEFVSDLVSKTISPDFNMLSVVTEKGKPLFMIVEKVEKGRFVSVQVIEPVEIAEAKRRHDVGFVKSVERSVLEEVFELQDRYGKTRDKRTYLLKMAVLLANALKKKKLVFSPNPPVLKSLQRAIRKADVDLEVIMNLRDYLASVEMASGKRSLFLDLGTPLRMVVQKGRLFELVDRVETSKNLHGLIDELLVWLADGFKDNSIRVEPGSFVWRGLERIVEHDAERVGRKMKFMLSMLADPLRLLVLVGPDAYVLEFKKGVISGIEKAKCSGGLKDAWLDICMRFGFVHLAFKADPRALEDIVSPFRISSVFRRSLYEFYPKNEFVSHLNEVGVLSLFLRLVYPFVKA